jgi:hypothetical protein
MITKKYPAIALAIAALSSSSALAGDLAPSVYVAPGGVYIGSARVYVAPNAGNGEQTYVVPGHAPSYSPHHAPHHAPAYAPGYLPEYEPPRAGYAPAYAPAPVYRAAPLPVYSGRPRVYASPYQTEYVPRPPAVVPFQNSGRHCIVHHGRTYCD